MNPNFAHRLIKATPGQAAIITAGALKAPAKASLPWFYLAPSPVTIVFSVLNTIRISSHNEKCLMMTIKVYRHSPQQLSAMLGLGSVNN